jgi:hypothetical protein
MRPQPLGPPPQIAPPGKVSGLPLAVARERRGLDVNPSIAALHIRLRVSTTRTLTARGRPCLSVSVWYSTSMPTDSVSPGSVETEE